MLNKLYSSLKSSFGNDWLKIEEPETFNIIFKKNGLEDPQNIIDIINALKSCILTISPWDNVYVFENCVDAFNEDPVIPETLTKPPLENIMYCVHLMNNLIPHVKIDNREFSDDIAKYIAAIAIHDGFIYLPSPLGFANKFIPDVDPELRRICETICENPSILSKAESFDESPEMVQAAKLSSILIAFYAKTEKQ